MIFSRHPDEWVQGDIYEPKSLLGLLALLDRYEGLPRGRKHMGEYQRVKAAIQLDDGTAVLAWLYLYRLPVNRSKRLHTGDFVRERRRSPERAGLSPWRLSERKSQLCTPVVLRFPRLKRVEQTGI